MKFNPNYNWLNVTSRTALAVVGGYFLTAALVSISAGLLARVMIKSEAVVLMAMLGFLIYAVILIWAFAERRQKVLWLVLGGGALFFQCIVYFFR